MKIFGIAGHSGMGKTTLLERLVPEITGRGLVVSLIKHSHKNIDIDRPGKDSYRLRESGCKEVLLLGNDRWALMHELRGGPELTLEDAVSRLSPCDLLLIEGYKAFPIPKIEVWRPAIGKPLLHPFDPHILAIAVEAAAELPSSSQPIVRLGIDDEEGIATFVAAHAVPWPLSR